MGSFTLLGSTGHINEEGHLAEAAASSYGQDPAPNSEMLDDLQATFRDETGRDVRL